MKFLSPSMIGATLLLLLVACGDSSHRDQSCNCTPSEPASQDYRHAAKHVPLPGGTPTETTVSMILSWPQPPPPDFNAPRTGRELGLYHIGHAFLQNARLIASDCDFHLEISDSASKTAARMIVETPSDNEYCPARQNLESALAQRGFQLRAGEAGQTELPQPLAVDVLGLAFEDFEHNRGTPQVATVWELHPAIVTLQP
jgi:hypothetical protein